jgi:hypothetical protein
MFVTNAGTTTMRDACSAVKTFNWFSYMLLRLCRDSLLFSTFTSTDI